MELGFILRYFQELGFHPTSIKECISLVSYSVIINEEPTGLFTPTRGIHQGDPFSPYIFIICMEVLTLWLTKAAARNKSGIGTKLCPRSCIFPGLFFADDCLLFCRTTTESCRTMRKILDDFCLTSGQLINYHKSFLTFSRNASHQQKQLVTSIINIPHRASLGKYLGCPIFQGRPGKATFKEIIDKATSKLQGWQAHCLSKADRAILIQSHLEALLAHTMQCFQLP